MQPRQASADQAAMAEESQNQNSTAINIFLKKKVRILLKSTYYKDPKVFYF